MVSLPVLILSYATIAMTVAAVVSCMWNSRDWAITCLLLAGTLLLSIWAWDIHDATIRVAG